MNSEQRKELIRSHIYGLTVVEMSEIYGISEDEIICMLSDAAAEIEDEREYRSSLQPKAQAAAPQLARAQAKTAQTSFKGVDLSVHNGAVDFAKVKSAGYTFAIIREGFGDEVSYPSQKDARFEQNYKNAKAAGMNVGAYHYLYATTVSGAKREAQGLVKNLSGKAFDMPIALDIEERSQYNLSRETVEGITKAFLDVCEAAGYYCMLYSYESFLTAKFSAAFRSRYDIWCANISRTPTIAYGIHQYSFTGRVNGISGNVDLNRTGKNYPVIIKNAGKNGFKPTGNVLDTDGFHKGDKGLGVYFLKRGLIASGYKLDDNEVFGSGTEKAVNDVLGKSGYARNGIAGKGFARKFIK